MKAYTQGITKEEFVNEMRHHQELDNFIKGTYDDGNKGCAVGCSLKSIAKIKNIDLDFSDHKNFEIYLGIPQWLAVLEDTFFERISNDRAKTWPVEFSEAINIGSDLNKIKLPFILFILKSNIETLESLNDFVNEELRKVINESKNSNLEMIKAQKSEDRTLIDKAETAAWSAAESAWSACSAAESAWSAAESAWLAAWSAAWSAAESAWLAAWSAWSSAESARSAARSAAESAWSAAESAWLAACSGESGELAARSEAYEKFANELLRLIRECK